MANLDHKEAFEEFKARTLEGIEEHFPVKGRTQVLELEKLEVDDKALHADDLRAQHKAKVDGKSWAAPIYAKMNLKDRQTGKVVDSKRVRVGELPMSTRRHSYILNGQEFQVSNQWQLKPGVYTRHRQSGELETNFNVPNKRSFDITFDPEEKLFLMGRGNAKKIPVYPLMKTLGVSDAELEKKWGKDILAINKATNAEAALNKFYKADKRTAPKSAEEAADYFVDTMSASMLRPDSTERTLGKKFDYIDGDTFSRATTKMLAVQQGKEKPDDRDSLAFKDLRSIGDYSYDKLTHYTTKNSIKNKMLRQINSATGVRDIVRGSTFNKPIQDTFSSNSLVNTAAQINPVEMVSSSMQTSILGPGGIQSAHAKIDDAKLINDSHLGFLDPIHTPESDATGVTLHLPAGVRKEGKKAKVPVYNLKTGKTDHIDVSTFLDSKVVLPDQVKWEKGKPSFIGKNVKMALHGNELGEGKASDAQYVMKHPSQMFSLTSNMIPFLAANSGNRASYATSHISQAISLKDREEPLVQSATGAAEEHINSFEALLGRHSSHESPMEGTVEKVTSTGIVLKDRSGKKKEVQIYNNFPLNDPKAVMHSEVLEGIKPGTKVKKGQLLADTNFTKNGRLALGTNLNVAYVPYKGYNFEDGIVISESAAKKLTSVHLHKPVATIDSDTVTDPKKFAAQHHGAYTKDQYKLVGTDGVVKVGQHVKPGDPLVLATRPYKLKDKTGRSAIRKSVTGVHTDTSLRWDSDHGGKVVSVNKNRKGEVTVHVKTEEPMQVGDKLCYLPDHDVLTRKGWKAVADITTEDEVCSLNPDNDLIEYLRPISLHSYACVNEGVYTLNTSQVSMAVTMDHKLYAREGSSYSLTAAKELLDKPYYLKSDGKWEGTLQEYFKLSGFLEETTLRMDSFLYLLGLYLTKGEALGGTGCGLSFVDISSDESKKLPNSYNYSGSFSKLRLHSAALYEFFKDLDGIPSWVFDLPPLQLAHLRSGLSWEDNTYSADTKKLAGDLQRLALCLGFSASVDEIHFPPNLIPREKKYYVRSADNSTPLVEDAHVKKYTGNVYCLTLPRNHVLYTRRDGRCHWSGNCGRVGNKGIVTKILADREMPHNKKGEHIEVALSPLGVPGRVNLGQVLETAASKIAKKTGKPYIVENFGGQADLLDQVKRDLKKHKLEDTEELFDPSTGSSLGKSLTGPQHMLKLTHQIDKKLSARSGMSIKGSPEKYDFNLMPSGGGKSGGQSFGNLGMYTLLAHGATSTIREAQTWKSEGEDTAADTKRWKSQHADVWNSIQNGDPLPTPKSTFAFEKFTSMLKASGVNVEKKGNGLQLTPLTDKQVLQMSSGELKKPAALTMSKLDDNGDPVPVKGGLFDPKITGGHGGKKWSHFKLAEPMPNPVFEKAIKRVLGLSKPAYEALVVSDKALDPKTGKVVPTGTKGSITGGPAISHMLSKMDTKVELKKAEAALAKVKMPAESTGMSYNKKGKPRTLQKLDDAYKKVKYLKALNASGMSAEEAYTLKSVPVIPPAMRPASVLPDGSIRWADLNGLYSELSSLNEQMKDPRYKDMLSDKIKRESRAGLYDGVKALMGIGSSYTDRKDKNKGLLQQIAGPKPKEGYFQKTLLNRRQDLTMRSTIIPEPAMGLDDVGLPSKKALTLFRPFVVKKLQDIGLARTPLQAQQLLDGKRSHKDKHVMKALDLVMEERPIVMKRDPALHKHSIQAFKSHRVPGKAIQIHPLVTSGFNADFDGDTTSVYVPISDEAVKETKKMYPSNNLFNVATGAVTNVPTLDSALGLYKMSKMQGKGSRRMRNPTEVLTAAKDGKLNINEMVNVAGVGKTTAGRILISSALPEGSSMQKRVLTDQNMTLDKKGLPKLYTELAKRHKGDFGDAANKLKDLGFDMTYGAVRIPNPNDKGEAAVYSAENRKNAKYINVGTHSLSLNDFTPDKATRDPILRSTQRRVDAINRTNKTKRVKEGLAVKEWTKATSDINAAHLKKAERSPDNLLLMLKAGVKPKPGQYQQLKLAPMLMEDSTGRVLPNPVTRSYAEGLDVSGYWTQMHGARKGSVQKVQEVQEPGYLSKQLINTTIRLQVNGADCKTDRGIALDIKSKDVYDRELASSIKVKGQTFGAGTLLSPDVVTQIRSGDPRAQVSVRSTLKCEHGKGLCQKCAGLAPNGKHYALGTNVGVLAAQSLGERAVQLTLKSFHSGGVAGGGGKTLGAFERVNQLTRLPKNIPHSATLAMQSGKIEKIEHGRLGTSVWVGGDSRFVPKDRSGDYLTSAAPGAKGWQSLRVGQRVEAGQSLSDPNRTSVNPHHLYRATRNIEKVHNHITNELHGIFAPEGVRRQHVETVVRGMGDLTRIKDAGGSTSVIKGEFQSRAAMRAKNRQYIQQGRKPIVHEPILRGVDVVPLEVQEDWMAKLNFQRIRNTIQESSATGAVSDLHGENPIAGMAYGAEFGKPKALPGAPPPKFGY